MMMEYFSTLAPTENDAPALLARGSSTLALILGSSVGGDKGIWIEEEATPCLTP